MSPEVSIESNTRFTDKQRDHFLDMLGDVRAAGSYEEEVLLGVVGEHFDKFGFVSAGKKVDDEGRALVQLGLDLGQSYGGEGPIPVLQKFVKKVGLDDEVMVDDGGEITFWDEPQESDSELDVEEVDEEPSADDTLPNVLDILADGGIRGGSRWTLNGRRHRRMEDAADKIRGGYAEKAASREAAQMGAVRLLAVHGQRLPVFGPIPRRQIRQLVQQDRDNGLQTSAQIIDDMKQRFNGLVPEEEIHQEYEKYERNSKVRRGAGFSVVAAAALMAATGALPLGSGESQKSDTTTTESEVALPKAEHQNANVVPVRTEQPAGKTEDVQITPVTAKPTTTTTTAAPTTTQAPAATTQPKPAPKPQPKPTVYSFDFEAYNSSWASTLIRPGDTAKDIIERLDKKTQDGHSWATIKSTDGNLTGTNTLIRGASISVRDCPEAGSKAGGGEIIQAGESIDGVLRKHGLTLEQAKRLNGGRLDVLAGFCLRVEAPR